MATAVDDLAAFLVAEGVATLGTNLFIFQLTESPDQQIALKPYGGLPSEQAFGDDALKWEFPRIQVICRGPRHDDRVAFTLAQAAYLALGKVSAETLSGTFWHKVTVLQPPGSVGIDNNDRPRWAFNVQCEKEVGA